MRSRVASRRSEMRRPQYDRYLEHLAVERKDRILTLSLNNPERLNANTEPMHWSLSRIWDDIDADPDVSVVIFTGVGERAFSAGGDPEHMEQVRDDSAYWLKITA